MASVSTTHTCSSGLTLLPRKRLLDRGVGRPFYDSQVPRICRRPTVPALRAMGGGFDAFDSVFPSVFPEMELLNRQVDRQITEMQRQMDALERQVDADVQRSLAKTRALQDQANQEIREAGKTDYGSNYDYRLRQNQGPGSYFRSESITVYGGIPTSTYLYRQPATPTASWSTLPLVIAATLAAVYAALTALFARNFQQTKYSDGARWRLTALWPVLAVSSEEFRQQFWGAVRNRLRQPPQTQAAAGKTAAPEKTSRD